MFVNPLRKAPHGVNRRLAERTPHRAHVEKRVRDRHGHHRVVRELTCVVEQLERLGLDRLELETRTDDVADNRAVERMILHVLFSFPFISFPLS